MAGTQPGAGTEKLMWMDTAVFSYSDGLMASVPTPQKELPDNVCYSKDGTMFCLSHSTECIIYSSLKS